MANAMWWVKATDKVTGQRVFLSLMSPDLVDTRKAKKRAVETAKARWARKGIKAVAPITVECVG